MMLDLAELSEDSVLQAELCIVGAGAAGIAMALRLGELGIDTLLLESGGEQADEATQALYQGSVSDPEMHSPPDRYRQRRFGGSTTIWGGRCTPFDPVDFMPRDYVPYSGWPIGLETLMPYYPAANRLCEAGEFAYTVASAFDGERLPMIRGFESQHFSTETLERFSCPTDFGARYAHKLRAASNVRVVLHANVTALNLDSAGRSVSSATVRSLDGRTITVRARRFVLATGGLEVARLLLASRDVARAGIGNDHDLVGRFYMCHIAGTIGVLDFAGPDPVWHDYDVADDGTYCRRRLALVASTQLEQGLGNFVARLHHPRITDPAHGNGVLSLLNLAQAFVPYEYGKRLHGAERLSVGTWLLHVRNVVLDPFRTTAFLWRWLRRRTLAERKFPSVVIRPIGNRYSLDFHVEQQPNPASRVTLGDERDALGMPKLVVDWQYTAGDLDTVQRALALLKTEFERSGVGRFDYDPGVVEHEMTRYGAYGGHHIGTARMGSDPATSVVDADCRVHGIDNLFIASSAVFATSSQANPTLTLIALSLRLVDHLASLSRESVVNRAGAAPPSDDVMPLASATA